MSKNAHNFPLGTGWNRAGDIPSPLTCFSTNSALSPVRQDEFIGSAFLLSKKTEISEKLGASLKAGLPKEVFPLDIELKLENELKSTQTNEVYVLAGVFISDVFETTPPTANSQCSGISSVQALHAQCGTHYLKNRFFGGTIVLFVNAGKLSPGERTAFINSFNPATPEGTVPDVASALAQFGALGFGGTTLRIETTLGAPSPSGQTLTVVDVLKWVDDLKTAAAAERAATPPRSFGSLLSVEIAPHPYAAASQCVQGFNMTEDEWNCLNKSLDELFDLQALHGSYSSVARAAERATTIITELANNPGSYVFGRVEQRFCPNDTDGDPFFEDCGAHLAQTLNPKLNSCREGLSAQISQCINAVAEGVRCVASENDTPQACRLSSICLEAVNIANALPTAREASTITPPLPGRRAMREYTVLGVDFGSGITPNEPVSDTLCMPNEIRGRLHNQLFSDVIARPAANGRWEFLVQGPSSEADRPSATFRCVDRFNFGSASWDTHVNAQLHTRFPGATSTQGVIGLTVGHGRFLHGLMGVKGAWIHPDDRVSVDGSPALGAGTVWRASLGPKPIGFGVMADIGHESVAFALNPELGSALQNVVEGSSWVQTDGARPIVTTIDLDIDGDVAFCFLNGFGGEFASREDQVRLLPHLKADGSGRVTWHVWVVAGYNAFDRRDVWARVQCAAFR